MVLIEKNAMSSENKPSLWSKSEDTKGEFRVHIDILINGSKPDMLLCYIITINGSGLTIIGPFQIQPDTWEGYQT